MSFICKWFKKTWKEEEYFITWKYMVLEHSNFTVHKCSLIGIQLCPICLHIACDCFCPVAQLNGDDRTKWPTKPKMFTVWPFRGKAPQSLVWKNGPHIHNRVLSGTWEETGADGEGERALEYKHNNSTINSPFQRIYLLVSYFNKR